MYPQNSKSNLATRQIKANPPALPWNHPSNQCRYTIACPWCGGIDLRIEGEAVAIDGNGASICLECVPCDEVFEMEIVAGASGVCLWLL